MKKTLEIKEVCEVFKVSKRTLERKISTGAIKAEAVHKEGRSRFIQWAELVRVLGEPPEPRTPKTPEPDGNQAQTNGQALEDLASVLKEQLAKAEAREKKANERAERLEMELSSARNRIDELTNGLVGHLHLNTVKQIEAPKPGFKGLLARFLGDKK